MYRLNVQVIAYGLQAVRSCDQLKYLSSNHITGTDELKVVKFCTQLGYVNSSNWMDDISPTKGACL